MIRYFQLKIVYFALVIFFEKVKIYHYPDYHYKQPIKASSSKYIVLTLLFA